METTPELEAMARAMEPSAFATYDNGYTQRNGHDLRAFLNAERTVKTARRKARAALAAIRELGNEPRIAAYYALDGYDIEQPDACTVREAHRAIIDHILGEPTPPAPRQDIGS
jgi:hypothetical protein